MSAEQDHHDPHRVLIHDFRNLLAVIVNYCELIAEETSDPVAIKADIAEVRNAAERALELTEKLRQIGVKPPEREPDPGST
jgi:signal transduction histidine kinase